MEAWLRGSGCVPLYNLMEDAATAEISRAQVWQWIHHRAVLSDGSDGRAVTPDLFRTALHEEMRALRAGLGATRFDEGRFADAILLFERLSTAPTFDDFLTLPAYEILTA
jgi:malate synthase